MRFGLSKQKIWLFLFKLYKKTNTPFELIERFFEINLGSFEYFFFSVTLLLLGKGLKGIAFLLVLVLSFVLFLGGVFLQKIPSHKKLSDLSLFQLSMDLFVLSLIVSIFIVVAYLNFIHST